jgi:hypothetical protein
MLETDRIAMHRPVKDGPNPLQRVITRPRPDSDEGAVRHHVLLACNKSLLMSPPTPLLLAIAAVQHAAPLPPLCLTRVDEIDVAV